jgi:hypothetical protein
LSVRRELEKKEGADRESRLPLSPCCLCFVAFASSLAGIGAQDWLSSNSGGRNYSTQTQVGFIAASLSVPLASVLYARLA